MTLDLKKLIALGGIVALSACGGAGTDPITDPDEVFGNPSNVGSATSVQDARDYVSDGFQFAENDNLLGPRNGNATYRGTWITGLIIEAQPEVDALIGEVDMKIDIGGGNNPVTGQITDLNTLDGNRGVELLDGTLDISGNIGGINRRFDSGASFEGDLTGFFGGTEELELTIDANVNGGWRDSGREPGDLVVGTTTGSASGASALGNVDITNGTYRADRQ